MHAHGDSPAHARVAGAAVRVLCGRVQYRKERAAAEEGMYVDVHEGRVRYSSPGTKDWLRRNISLTRAHKKNALPREHMLDPMHNTALLMYFVRAAHHEARRPRPRCARDSLSPSALIRLRMAHGSVLGSWLGATGSCTRSESVASKEEWARLAAGHRSSEAYELASSLSSEKVMRRSTRAGSCNSSERRG